MDTQDLRVTMDIPEGAVVIRAVEVVEFLAPSGEQLVGFRLVGQANLIATLGMLEYAKGEARDRFDAADLEDDEAGGDPA